MGQYIYNFLNVKKREAVVMAKMFFALSLLRGLHEKTDYLHENKYISTTNVYNMSYLPS